ncbi:MAG: sigma-54 dependent transcriptional regulator [Gemmatimonadota bacterium]|nr:sigma-54 dependent transcriptional regulator [Gemmatimonadota bacterium]
MSRVLVVDDESGLRQGLRLLLSDAGYDVATESDGAAALERAARESFDLVLCDVRMAGMDGLEFLRRYRDAGGTALVIMMSAYGGEEAALGAMKEGAYDYIPKPFRPDEVILTLRKAEERERLRRDVARLTAELDRSPDARAIIGGSAGLRAALDVVSRVAAHKTTVLVTGESGTGKDVFAHAIHRASPRAHLPFVAVNCAAIPAALLESELFGHVRGSFTGATGDRPGLFEQADGGTLFLDEIGDLPLELQAKLLRALQDGEIRRVGDKRTRRVDVRLVAATARDLAAEAAAGRFREDLYFRLNVVQIRLPALRERRDDIAPLAAHFAVRLGRRLGHPVELSAAAVEWLTAQPWRGNVRELEHAIERAAVLSASPVLEPGHFSAPAPAAADPVGDGTLEQAVATAERRAIAAALEAAGHSRRDAAQRLGISVRTLFYKLRQHRLD